MKHLRRKVPANILRYEIKIQRRTVLKAVMNFPSRMKVKQRKLATDCGKILRKYAVIFQRNIVQWQNTHIIFISRENCYIVYEGK